MPFLDIPKGALHYDVHGHAGPWVLILPGAFSAPWQYHPLRDALAPDFRVVTLDYRGIAQSRSDLWHVTPDRLAEDVLLLLDHLGAERVHAVPVSLGVVVLAEMLHRQPERVERAAIAGMLALRGKMRALTPESPKPGEPEMTPMQHLVSGTLNVFATRWFRETQPERFAFMRARMLELSAHDIFEGVRQFYGVFGHDSARMRVLESKPRERIFLFGEEDPLTPMEDATEHPAFRSAPTLAFRGSGHLFFYEMVGEFNGVVHHWLRTGTLPALPERVVPLQALRGVPTR